MATLLIVELYDCGCKTPEPYGRGTCPYFNDGGNHLTGYVCTLDNHEDSIVHDLFKKCPLQKVEPNENTSDS